MQAIILAAGMGKRLKELTSENTKCMIKVNGITLIERMLSQLDQFGLSKIVIVIGYKGERLRNYIEKLSVKTPIEYVENQDYYKTNNIYSLFLARKYLVQEDTLLLESDLIFETSVLECIINDERNTLALVDKYESWMDGTVVKISSRDQISDFIPGKKFKFSDIGEYYKTVNIYKFSKEFSKTHYVPFLEAYSMALGNNEYYEQVLRVITLLDNPVIKAKKLDGQMWYEIDDIQDLNIAESIFSPNDDDKVSLIQKRYGGYWRYPKLMDFCYLVNPYFPPQRLLNEIKANFEKLITQYPSGMEVNCLLASKNFSVPIENIVVGNGAAELINAIMQAVSGKVGIIRPTFEEYPNRYPKENQVVFTPLNESFRYDENDLIEYYEDKGISALVLINPDNPSGNYIEKNGILKLIEWTERKSIRLILDESFIDFSDEEDPGSINSKLISRYKNLIIVKSLSKSYGIPGLRLGIAVSGDEELIAHIKSSVSIWNINSFAEFYMQIEEKYRSDYEKSLIKTRKSRYELMEGLKKLPGITPIPSQANYITCILGEGISSKALTRRLLKNHNIFIKDLTPKIKGDREYIRVAVKTESENKLLLNALEKEI